jgi:hypothetical protein
VVLHHHPFPSGLAALAFFPTFVVRRSVAYDGQRALMALYYFREDSFHSFDPSIPHAALAFRNFPSEEKHIPMLTMSTYHREDEYILQNPPFSEATLQRSHVPPPQTFLSGEPMSIPMCKDNVDNGTMLGLHLLCRFGGSG